MKPLNGSEWVQCVSMVYTFYAVDTRMKQETLRE